MNAKQAKSGGEIRFGRVTEFHSGR
jgi:hypothetical protein